MRPNNRLYKLYLRSEEKETYQLLILGLIYYALGQLVPFKKIDNFLPTVFFKFGVKMYP